MTKPPMTTPITAEELACQSALYALDKEQLHAIANLMLVAPHRFAALVQAECCERAFRRGIK